MTPDSQRPILYFDGVCNLCDRFVQFVIRHDKRKRFLFASLQSQAGLEALAQNTVDGKAPDSVILWYKGRFHTRSAAALHTLRLLGGIRSLAFACMIIPRFLRDPVYDMVARNRYRWFGRKAECMVPTPELAARFLSE